MGAPIFIATVGFSLLLVIMLLYPVALGTGAQSVTADRDTRRSDGSNERKGVR